MYKLIILIYAFSVQSYANTISITKCNKTLTKYNNIMIDQNSENQKLYRHITYLQRLNSEKGYLPELSSGKQSFTSYKENLDGL